MQDSCLSCYVNVVFWNVRSINNKTKDVLQVLDDGNIDIALIGETWFGEETNYYSKLIKDEGNFNVISQVRGSGKRGGGVAILVKNTIGFKPCKSNKFSTFEYADAILNLTCNDKVHLVYVYRLGETSTPVFFSELTDFLSDLSLKNEPLVVAGDYNIHWNEGHRPEVSKLNDIMNDFGLSQLVPYGATHRDGNMIDLLFCDVFIKYKV